jgi:hypothetical protein
MIKTKTDYPSIRQSDLSNAKLYANRNELVADLKSNYYNKKIAEIGVALGDFSDFILNQLNPQIFVAFDFFDIHNQSILWGRPTAEIFNGRTHQQFYQDRFKHLSEIVVIEQGLSKNTLPTYPNSFFDIIYIDAGHYYEDVLNDALNSVDKLDENGVLIFNDYIMYDHCNNEAYGVIPVVNELVVNNGWKIKGFALQNNMFCDISISRR